MNIQAEIRKYLMGMIMGSILTLLFIAHIRGKIVTPIIILAVIAIIIFILHLRHTFKKYILQEDTKQLTPQ